MQDDPRRQLPAIDRVISDELAAEFGAARVTLAARRVIGAAREHAQEGRIPDLETLRERLRTELSVCVAPVINATGVLLHTNLGRAPWSEHAVTAAVEASGYVMLELDARTGKRGERGAGIEDRLRALTGAEAALVVNNGAAAVLLALSALAEGGEVLVSRSQLIEIGGGFRIPEILEVSGSTLVEVGTTNRTHLRDYERAMSDAVGAVLWVHSSNFRQIGFTTQPGLRELATLRPLLIADLGSGAIEAVADEPPIRSAIDAGADVVCFSGDKLLGGPQAGIAIGRRRVIQRLREHPLARALRVDKVISAALEATLDDHLIGRSVPVQAMLEVPTGELRAVAQRWLEALPEGVAAEVVDVEGAVGGGSLPGRRWPSVALAIAEPSPMALRDALLRGEPRVIGRVKEGRLLLDARTVAPLGRAGALADALLAAIAAVAR